MGASLEVARMMAVQAHELSGRQGEPAGRQSVRTGTPRKRVGRQNGRGESVPGQEGACASQIDVDVNYVTAGESSNVISNSPVIILGWRCTKMRQIFGTRQYEAVAQ